MEKSGAKKAGDGAARLQWYCAVCISQAQKQSFVCRFFMILTLVSEARDAACRNVRTLWQFLLPEQPNPMRFVCEKVRFVDFFDENVVWGLNFYLLRIV